LVGAALHAADEEADDGVEDEADEEGDGDARQTVLEEGVEIFSPDAFDFGECVLVL